MPQEKSLGFQNHQSSLTAEAWRNLRRYANLLLASQGLPVADWSDSEQTHLFEVAESLVDRVVEKNRLLGAYRSPVDQRIETFLRSHFADQPRGGQARLPVSSLELDRHGVARVMSIPADGSVYESELLTSYRVRNGVLHNPRSDRRTTQGTFHICEGGLPVPGDKLAVPRATYLALLQAAVTPPPEMLELPFTAKQTSPTRTWVSLLLRPIVAPAVEGYSAERTMEIRFFAPGSLVSNLDFVESIFGNAGDPSLLPNDSALDVEHWTGHTGCVILAPHLTQLTKKSLGLPSRAQATPQQLRDGMYWDTESDLYNGGNAFKVTCRTQAGVIVTIIADNYYGYCKKEVKTQISYAANLMGNVEEEHAGGALVFASFSLGEQFQFNSRRYNGRTIADVFRDYPRRITIHEHGYGIDRHFPEVIYIPEDARADLRDQNITWSQSGTVRSIPLLPGQVYVAPSGYKLRMEKHPQAPSWRLIGTAGEGVFIHKPCTVSGGGKSEISKPIGDYMQYGPIYTQNFEKDAATVDMIFAKDYSVRWRSPDQRQDRYQDRPSRPLLSADRSLGSVIKLLTPSEEYHEDYNFWLSKIPNHIHALVYAIKRLYQPDWGDDWRKHFRVDIVNGVPGHELKLHDRKIVGSYLRVGLFGEHGWRTFKVRQDFAPSAKVQTEDDISAAIVVPGDVLTGLNDNYEATSFKFIANCESRLFQRPDDAVHRGLDKQAEADLARRDVNFVSNYEPLSRATVEEMLSKVVDFDAFTKPMQELLLSMDRDQALGEGEYIVCSDNPRRIDGVPSKNPRYLQDRPDLVRPLDKYLAELGVRLYRQIPDGQPVPLPVNAVISGRRNNPPEPAKQIRSLAVYNPLHFQELPELFMDYICSLTGKSPSTTGAGSEGALTKGPFNALRTTADLNAALVSMILTNLPGYSSAAGHVGPNHRFDHDISLLVPEVWCRMSEDERTPAFLIEHKYLERVEDVEFNGQKVPSRRLGWRITERFVKHYFARIFDNPDKVFDVNILQPERQDPASFADGINYIMEAYQRVALQYFEDGSIDEACPPIRALLSIMAHGQYDGKDETHPAVRQMFTRDYLLASPWYQGRLQTRQQRDIELWSRHVESLQQVLASPSRLNAAMLSEMRSRLTMAQTELLRVKQPAYLQSLVGTLGA
ncbi:MAG: hypothetical protein DWH91_13765 [Planctomycetota bacterium]|nr:MAG: hypothetical protein DWH91_13765 [Planctomycetota bacterium]